MIIYGFHNRLQQFCSIFLCIFCKSRIQVYDICRTQRDMNGHLSVFYGQSSFSVTCLIYLKHTAVCIKISSVSSILQYCSFCCLCICCRFCCTLRCLCFFGLYLCFRSCLCLCSTLCFCLACAVSAANCQCTAKCH